MKVRHAQGSHGLHLSKGAKLFVGEKFIANGHEKSSRFARQNRRGREVQFAGD